jgi:hypothetical protein
MEGAQASVAGFPQLDDRRGRSSRCPLFKPKIMVTFLIQGTSEWIGLYLVLIHELSRSQILSNCSGDLFAFSIDCDIGCHAAGIAVRYEDN